MFMVDICRYDISIYLYSCSEADRPTEGNWAPLVARSHERLCLCKININQPHDGYNLVIWSIRIIDYRLYNQHMMYGIYIAYIYIYGILCFCFNILGTQKTSHILGPFCQSPARDRPMCFCFPREMVMVPICKWAPTLYRWIELYELYVPYRGIVYMDSSYIPYIYPRDGDGDGHHL